MIDTDLVSFITQLNTAATDRVHLGNVPQGGVLPAVVIRRSGGSRPRTLGGVSLFQRSQFAIHVLTPDDYGLVYPIANMIFDALHGFNGILMSTTVQSARCIAFPSDKSEIDGDRAVRWVEAEYLFVHS